MQHNTEKALLFFRGNAFNICEYYIVDSDILREQYKGNALLLFHSHKSYANAPNIPLQVHCLSC
jgi:hypothetical protein